MKYTLVTTLLLILSAPVFSQSDIATARWMKQPVVVDGNNTEWGSLNFSDLDTQLSFAVADDSNTIYLCFESQDERSQMKLMRAGMKVTLSTKGKVKHNASVLFPLPQNRQPQPAIRDSSMNNSNGYPGSSHNTASFRRNYIRTHNMMDISGFTSGNGEVSINDSPAVRAAFNWDSASNFFYEVAIAKTAFFGTGYTQKETTGDINLSVEINGLPRSALGDESRGGNHDGGGMPETGMHGGGFNGGGMRRGNEMQPQMNAGNQSLGDKASFKQKFVLTDHAPEQAE